MSPGLRVRGRFTLTAGMSALYIEQSTRFNRQNDSFLLTYRQHRELTAGKNFSFSNFKGYFLKTVTYRWVETIKHSWRLNHGTEHSEEKLPFLVLLCFSQLGFIFLSSYWLVGLIFHIIKSSRATFFNNNIQAVCRLYEEKTFLLLSHF